MIRLSNLLEIRFETNEIIRMKDNTSERIKVEPRIMRVLQILIDNSPNVVSREQLIAEIWDNYGGADDALNQSISHLRRILNDTNKEKRIIETVVKKGYRFTGEIEKAKNIKKVTDRMPQKSRIWIAVIVIASIVVAIWFYILSTRDALAPKAPIKTGEKVESVLSPKD